SVFWMLSCKGVWDNDFNKFLIDHGTQCIIGSTESVSFAVLLKLVSTVFVEMLEKNNKGAKISNAWNMGVDENGICTYDKITNKKIEFDDFWNYYKGTHSILNRLNKDEIKEFTINNGIIAEDLIKEYLEYYNDAYAYEIEKIYLTPEDDKDAGSFDYTSTVSNHVKYITQNGDFTYGGTGTLSGTVVKGETVRTIHSDGTYDEIDNTSEPLAYANISAYRFINQFFMNKDISEYYDETVTDKDGKFKFENIDWGLYAAEVDYSSYEGEASIILTSDTTDGGNIVARSGYASMSGYVQGYTDEEKTKTEFLDGAKISLSSVEEIDGEYKTYDVKTNFDGYFEIKDIEAGDYNIKISHSDYEDYTSTLTFKKGYEYKYEEGCFILENDLSTTDIVFVLDVSGSMNGTPIESLKSAVKSFADSMIGTDDAKDSKISIVSFSESAAVVCEFTKYKSTLYSAATNLKAGGGTNIEAGLSTAYSMLKNNDAKNKTIVLMSDGCPNRGKEGSSLVVYANDIKADGITIYTQGFFSELSSDKAEAQSLMDDIASEGYHYEIENASDLVDFYDDLADQLNGQQYDHAKIACPVDVSVTYNGETLNSSEDSLCTRTSFGTLTFEEDEEADEGEDNRVKILRLKSGIEYDVKIVGTGTGYMDYTVSYMNDDGVYDDIRKFRNVEITEDTVIDTTLGYSKSTIVNVDGDGDGEYDIVYQAKKNEYGELKNEISTIYIVSGTVILLLLIISVIALALKSRKRKKAK
ncbi:MAG: VWA domain-containing protein, partial [Firmicutes bacterium]|nr:VWA domain-containing protein [Bacillota bacterium]